MPGGTPDSAKVAQELMGAPALLSKQTRGLYPPPQAVLASMVTQAKRQHGNTNHGGDAAGWRQGSHSLRQHPRRRC